jgi:cytochrome d ubiquinol oxidase subunit I
VGTAFMLAALYAWKRLRGNDSDYARRAFRLALSVGLIAAILAAIGGSLSASFVAANQPEKFAAMEGLYVTQARASETFFGITVPIPGLLSFLATGSFDGVVIGLDAFPSSTWPNVALVHTAFNLVVTFGIVLILVAAATVLTDRVRRLGRLQRLSLYALVVAGPMAYTNFLLGWIVTEAGRQPWMIQDVMTVDQGFTATGDPVPALFAAFVIFYAALLALTVLVLRRLYATPPREPRVFPGASHG